MVLGLELLLLVRAFEESIQNHVGTQGAFGAHPIIRTNVGHADLCMEHFIVGESRRSCIVGLEIP